MPTLYTPPGGNSPASTQLAALQTQIAGGQTFTPQQTASVQQGIQGANAAVGQLNTEQGRQPYLDNTNYGAASGNYDQLAQQLAQYDNLVLKPEFAGNNPNLPQDRALGGVTSALPEFSSGYANLSPDQLTYHANPAYALNAQLGQADNINNLLTTITSLMGKERDRGTAKYTSDLKAASSILGALTDILGQSSSLKMREMELAESRASRASTKADSAESQVKQAQAELDAVKGIDGKVAPTDYQRIRQKYSAIIDPKDFDGKFSSGYVNKTHAQDYALINQFGDLPSAQQTKLTVLNPALSQLERFKKEQGGSYEGTGIAQGALMKIFQNAPGAAQGIADPKLITLNSRIGPLRDTVLNYLSGAGVTGTEQARVLSWIPDVSKSPQKNAQDLISLQNYLNDSYKGITQQDYYTQGAGSSGGGTTIMTGPGGTFNVPNDKVEAFRQNGYK